MFQLEQFLQQYFPDRESHSILGSTFLNPTTAAGVAFGSGGTQCRKGPAYTERALYIMITENKWQEQQIEIVNTLEIDGFNDSDLPIGQRRKQMDTIPYRIDTWGRWIQKGYERDMKYTTPSILDQMNNSSTHDGTATTYPLASDAHYGKKLCRKNSTSVSRYNADCSGPDCCRSEGKVIILATVHDTFPKPKSKKTFWVSFDSIETALEFRQQVALDNPTDLPISMEYMDRDAFDVIDEAGRVLGNLIKYIGTSSTLIRQMWNVKLYIEALPYDSAPLWVDQIMYRLNQYFPPILSKSIMEIGRRWDHHVMLTIGDFDNGSMDRMIVRMNEFAQQRGSDKICIHECDCHAAIQKNGDVATAAAINAFRFVAAPAFRTWCVGHKLHGFSVDYVLPKNGGSIPSLHRSCDPTNNKTAVSKDPIGSDPNTSLEQPLPVKRMRYSHFACNVVHEDLAYDIGVDIDTAKHNLKYVIEHECSGKLPAEHGHGTEYIAPPTTQERWKRMDPLNIFNPGIGGLSANFRYKDD
jgi:D-lactate dehydrogenase (quinone)